MFKFIEGVLHLVRVDLPVILLRSLELLDEWDDHGGRYGDEQTHDGAEDADPAVKLIGRDSDGNERIYDIRGIEKKAEKGIYIKGGKVKIKN